MSTPAQWPIWTCPNCHEPWHSGREYCITCKYGMVQDGEGAWVPGRGVVSEILDRETRGVDIPSPEQVARLVVQPDTGSMQAREVAQQTARVVLPPGAGAQAATMLKDAMDEANTLRAEAALAEDRRRRLEAEVSGLLVKEQQRTWDCEQLHKDVQTLRDRVREVEEQRDLFRAQVRASDDQRDLLRERVQTLEREQEQWGNALYEVLRPLVAALQESGHPVGRIDTVIPAAVQMIRTQPHGEEPSVPAVTPDLLAAVAQLELRVQTLEQGTVRQRMQAAMRSAEAQTTQASWDALAGTYRGIEPPQIPDMGGDPRRGGVPPPPSQWQAYSVPGPELVREHPVYPTWILTDAMQARLEKDLLEEQRLRGGPAYGGSVPR